MNNDYLSFLKFTKKVYKNINWNNRNIVRKIRNVWFEVRNENRYSLTKHFFDKQKLLLRFGFREEKKSYRLNSIQYWMLRGWSEEHAKNQVYELQSSASKKGIKRYGCSSSSKEFLRLCGKSENEIDDIMKSRKRFSFSDLDETELKKISKKGSDARTAQIKKLKECDSFEWKQQFSTTKEFYIVRGFSEEESLKLLKERQITFSLEKLRSQFDEKTALDLWEQRQEKWQNTLSLKSEEEKKEINAKKAVTLENLQRKYGKKVGQKKYYEIVKNRKTSGSKEATQFFNRLLLEIDFDEEPYWSHGFTNNEYFLFDKTNNKFYFYDFVLKNRKLIIEYHGESFHPRKSKLTEKQWTKWKVPFTNESADSKFTFDQTKNNFAKSEGFEVVVVWSSDTFEESVEKIVKLL